MGYNDERKNAYYASITGTGLLKITFGAKEGATLFGKKAEIFEYEDTKKVKHEQWAFLFTSFTGFIEDISVVDTDFGKQLKIEMVDDKKIDTIIQMPNKGSYAYSFLETVYNIDFDKEVKIGPWSWAKDGKVRKGITLTQDGKKVPNYFYDSEAKKRINGYPEPSGDTKDYDSDDWKEYFDITVRKFLYDFLDKKILPKMETLSGLETPPLSKNEIEDIEGLPHPDQLPPDDPPTDLPF